MASVVLADFASEADVVGRDAVVLLGALDPAAHVVLDPLDVLLVAGIEISVGNQRCCGHVDRHVAFGHAVAHDLNDPPELIVIGMVVDPARW